MVFHFQSVDPSFHSSALNGQTLLSMNPKPEKALVIGELKSIAKGDLDKEQLENR